MSQNKYSTILRWNSNLIPAQSNLHSRLSGENLMTSTLPNLGRQALTLSYCMKPHEFRFSLCVCIREDDKHSVDIHDNPPAPDNVVKEDGDTVSGRTMSTPHC